MIPEPTTAASNIAAPSVSAMTSRGSERLRLAASTDAIEFSLGRHPVELRQGQIAKEIHARADLTKHFAEERPGLFVAALKGRRIGKAPMCGQRLTRPDGTNLAGCRIAHRGHEVHAGRVGSRKFVPTFGTQIAGLDVYIAQSFECQG